MRAMQRRGRRLLEKRSISRTDAGDIEGDAFVDRDARRIVTKVVEPEVDQLGPSAH